MLKAESAVHACVCQMTSTCIEQKSQPLIFILASEGGYIL